MSAPSTYSYDIFPYESHPFAQSHPDRLATIATLLGLKPPPVAKCRVLEIGCSDGGNLIPMAVALPGSTFLGIDLSVKEIEHGRGLLAKLQLPNVELRQVGIEEFANRPSPPAPLPKGERGEAVPSPSAPLPKGERGEAVPSPPAPPAPLPKGERGEVFDYIICHGVYSWVPAGVQDKILDICKHRLAPSGIAYISYNTYPGWHLRGMIRDMMKYHTRPFNDPVVRVKQARNLLDFLARALDKDKSSYSLNLKSELELVRHCRDSYLFHEHLEDSNEPTYFHQFAERATAKGLRYLGEADFAAMVPGNYPPEISNVLHMMAVDLIQMEQYMDFLRNRTFRQSLLCHEQQTPNYKLNPETIKQLYVASPVKPVKDDPDVRSDQPEEFKASDGAVLASRKPIMKAALVCLAKSWPRPMSFASLCEQARVLLKTGADGTRNVPIAFEDDAKTLANGILTTYASLANHIIELHVAAPAFVTSPSERPRASPLARLQAETGGKLTNLRHEPVEIEAEFDRQMLRLLDGTRTGPEIVEALAEAVAVGSLVISQEGVVLEDRAQILELFHGAIERQLGELSKNALLLE